MSKNEFQTANVRRTLFVKLTPDEKAERAVTAARRSSEIATVKAQAKNAAAVFKQELKPLEQEHTAAVDAHVQGAEFRDVDCQQVFDVQQKRTWFEYIGERYSERAMNEQELRECKQRLFKDEPPLPEGETKPAKAKKSKADPKYELRAVGDDVGAVIREETKRGGKKDLVT